MPQQIVIAEHLRIAALLTDERIDELIVAQGSYQVGDVFLGSVEQVRSGIDAAFVILGENEKNGFLPVSELGPLRLKKATAGIRELLEPDQKVLVQVKKEPTGTKGPSLTGNLSLAGRFLILKPYGQGVNISGKIRSEAERNRLRALGVLIKPQSTGLVIRTEAENISEEFLIDDLENLLKKWDLIQQAYESCTPPILLNRDEDFIHKILRDKISQNVNHIIVDNPEAVTRVKNFLGKESKELIIDLHSDSDNILEKYKVISAINDALKQRVDLPSGGYIIIEPTEALTVIDVNSGSFTSSENSRQTVLWTNCDAAIEIARQLKLRNIGGIIIIDFIDMETKRDQLQLLERFTNALSGDYANPQIISLTELGLVELTRKRQGQNIYELFGKNGPNATGLNELTNITIQDINQAISSEAQVKNSTLILGNELEYSKGNNIKKKSITKLKDIEKNSINEEDKSSNSTVIPVSIETNGNEISINKNNHKKEKSILHINMNEKEEMVYSSMGLDPVLLLEESPFPENYTVHIIRPGEEQELEGEKNITLLKNKNPLEKASTNCEEIEVLKEEKLKVDIDLDEVKNELINADKISTNEQDELNLNENKETDEDPRRKRRRSSATS